MKFPRYYNDPCINAGATCATLYILYPLITNPPALADILSWEMAFGIVSVWLFMFCVATCFALLLHFLLTPLYKRLPCWLSFGIFFSVGFGVAYSALSLFISIFPRIKYSSNNNLIDFTEPLLAVGFIGGISAVSAWLKIRKYPDWYT